MLIYKPFPNQYLTQKFGENKNDFYRKIGMEGHNGWDWHAEHGEHIYYDCNLEGTVLSLSTEENEGLGITIITQEGDKYYKHRYWHLKPGSFKVQPGDKVRMGRWLADADNTGYSTGDHLHRDLKECDFQGYTKNQRNGYLGGLDLEPYFVDKFVLDYLTFIYKLMVKHPTVAKFLKRLVLIKS